MPMFETELVASHAIWSDVVLVGHSSWCLHIRELDLPEVFLVKDDLLPWDSAGAHLELNLVEGLCLAEFVPVAGADLISVKDSVWLPTWAIEGGHAGPEATRFGRWSVARCHGVVEENIERSMGLSHVRLWPLGRRPVDESVGGGPDLVIEVRGRRDDRGLPVLVGGRWSFLIELSLMLKEVAMKITDGELVMGNQSKRTLVWASGSYPVLTSSSLRKALLVFQRPVSGSCSCYSEWSFCRHSHLLCCLGCFQSTLAPQLFFSLLVSTDSPTVSSSHWLNSTYLIRHVAIWSSVLLFRCPGHGPAEVIWCHGPRKVARRVVELCVLLDPGHCVLIVYLLIYLGEFCSLFKLIN